MLPRVAASSNHLEYSMGGALATGITGLYIIVEVGGVVDGEQQISGD
jgi:hypothetical protein